MTETAQADYDTELSLIDPEEIDDAWSLVEQMISAALMRSNQHTAADILKDLLNDDAQLWIAGNTADGVLGVMVTYMQHTTLSDHMRIFLCIGEQRERWMHHLAVVEQWAKDRGAERIIAVARPGWEKVLLDYRKTHSTLEKNL